MGNNEENYNARPVKKKRRALRVILVLLFVAAIAASFVLLWRDSRPADVLYTDYTVTRGDIENTSIATGKISPRDVVSVKPQISGIISEIMKEPGDRVKKNEVIAVVKVVPEMGALNAAQARLEVAQINLKQIEEMYNRQKMLYESKVIAKEAMDKAEAEYKTALVELNNSRDNLDIVRSGISRSTGGNTRVQATIEGTVLTVPVKVGTSVIQSNTFNDGTTVATVADMSDMLFIGDLDETEIDRVYVGMPLKISIGALEKRKFDAELEYIAPQGVEANGAILFEIKAKTFIPDSVTIRAGYSANAEITMDKAEDVLMLPENAVEMDGGKAFVYKVTEKADKTVTRQRQEVTLGISDGVYVEIKQGLSEGDTVAARSPQ